MPEEKNEEVKEKKLKEEIKKEKKSKYDNHRLAFEAADGNVKEQVKVIEDFVDTVLVANIDYGISREDAKPSLFKSGAEKLSYLLNVYPDIKVISLIEDWNIERQFTKYKYYPETGERKPYKADVKGFVSITVQCDLRNKLTNDLAGGGLGQASTWEGQYSYSDASTSSNTVVKIAKKRAFVDAMMGISLVSEFFTQDLEDLVDITKETNAKKAAKKTYNNSSPSYNRPANVPGGESHGYREWPLEKALLFGSQKGKPITDCKPEELDFYINVSKQSYENPNDQFRPQQIGFLKTTLQYLKDNNHPVDEELYNKIIAEK